MKVLLIDTLHKSFSEELQSIGFNCIEGYDWTKEKVMNCINEFDGLAIRSRFKLDEAILKHSHKIKFIARAGAGMENIDVAYAKSKNIICLNAPEGNRDAVGEHAVGMLLSLFNNLNKADAEVRNGIWLREENRGIELSGKTIGLIGFGNMGSTFSKKLSGFDCKILTYDKYITIDQNKFPFVTPAEMKEIFNESDIISFHVPLTDETRFIANENYFNSFRKNIYVINTSRGQVVETEALVNAMKNGKVMGACIDVLEYESLSFEQLDKNNMPEPLQYLIKSDKVILSPHIAGWTHESNEKMARVLFEKIKNLYADKK